MRRRWSTTTWGNVDVDTAARNTAFVLDMVGGADVPVARGAEGPSNGHVATFSPEVHGEDGQGDGEQIEERGEHGRTS